jgi:ATP-dependent Lhr-like helicase
VSAFEQLHPALQHHIVNSLGWSALRPVQEEAIEGALAGANLVILAPTAGGKTEAAFFPLLSRMLSEPWTGLSVVYVSPLKALLNNQEQRLSRYFALVGRRAGVWHGDVSKTEKGRLAGDPPDCLLTTPESLEVMLASGNVRHERLFADVRAVVIDEVHAFANDDRGWHLLAVIERIGKLAGRDLQRLGLSATVGNPEDLAAWLSGGSRRARRVVDPGTRDPAAPQVEIDHVHTLSNAARVIHALYAGEKRLVFCDSRSRVEKLAAELQELGTRTFVSHSSLGVEERREAERAFAEGQACVIVATSALELGIDVGDLDRVIQIDAPGTVSSFLQRMGRTGRRPGTARNCLFLATSDDSLLRAAGLVELWRRGHVEPVAPPSEPLHVLAQQLMALALQERGILRSSWLEWVAGVPAFAALPRDTVESIVAWMLQSGILWDEEGILWLGRRGEEEFGRRNFLELFSVFTSPPLFEVRHGKETLGSVHESTFLFRRSQAQEAPALLLAGRSWRVTHLDWTRRRAQVEPTREEGRSVWRGEGQHLSFRLCQAVLELLASRDERDCWSKRARSAMEHVREAYPWAQTDRTTLTTSAKSGVEWWTFAGGAANACLSAAIERQTGQTASFDNFAVRLRLASDPGILLPSIETLRRADPAVLRPRVDDAAVDGLKFSACLPRETAIALLERRMSDGPALAAVLARPYECLSGD